LATPTPRIVGDDGELLTPQPVPSDAATEIPISSVEGETVGTLVRADGERLDIVLPPDAPMRQRRRGMKWVLVLTIPIVLLILWEILRVAQLQNSMPTVTVDLPPLVATARTIEVVFPTLTPNPTRQRAAFGAGIQLYDVATQRQLVPNCSPVGDYASLQIVFSSAGLDELDASRTNVERHLYLMTGDGTDICLLLNPTSSSNYLPRWSSHTDSIVFIQSGQLIQIGFENGQYSTRTLVNNRQGDIQAGDVSSELGQIVYTRAGLNEIVIDDTLFALNGASYPVWSPDGSAVALNSSSQGDALGRYLTVLRAPTSRARSVRWLTSQPVLDIPPSWSPDGLSIAYVSIEGYLHVVDMASRRSFQVPNTPAGIYSVDWLSSGEIAFAAPVDGARGAIFVTDLDGRMRQVTPRIMGLDSFDWR
jgi:Tol biopolymer transport system component